MTIVALAQVPLRRCAVGGSNCKVNYDVDETEFPCDLFQYIFKTQAWEDDAVH